MQQGVCIDTGLSAILKKGSMYFLQEHGKNNYYVSNFKNSKSYFGSYPKKHFRLIVEPRQSLRRFVARVSKKYTWYTLGDEYIITEKDHNGYFHVYSKNKPYKGPIGSYLKKFFEIIAPFDEVDKPEKTEATKALKTLQTGILKREEFIQLSLFDYMES